MRVASFDGDGSARIAVRDYESACEPWWPRNDNAHDGEPDTCTKIGIAAAYGGPTGKIAVMLDAFKQTKLFYDLVVDAMTAISSQPHSGEPSWFLIGGGNQWSMSKYGASDALGPLYKSVDAVRAVGNGLRRMTAQ